MLSKWLGIGARELTDAEIAGYDKWEKERLQSITSQIVEYFPEVMFFHTIFVGLCIIRSPTDFAVSCTLVALIMRIVMVFGFYCNKKAIYLFPSGMEVLANFCLLFSAMAHNQYATS